MQTKTILALFCVIVVLLLGCNDSASTVIKPVAPQASLDDRSKTSKFAGGRTPWKTNFDERSKKLFNDHKAIVSKKLNAAYKVPITFDPKPAKYSTQVVSGILYHYLVQIPNNKYAHVTIVHRGWRKDKTPNEANVKVREQLYGSIDKVL